jgi:hypothetical protein
VRLPGIHRCSPRIRKVRAPVYLRLHALLFGSLALAILLPRACAQTIAASQNTPPAPYTPQVWDIDWSYLREARSREDWTDRLHYIPLGKSPAHFLSITGQVRERGEYQDHPAFGAQPANNGYLLQRYLLSGDLEAGEHFRTFIQLDSGLINGRDGGPRPEIDEDRLDFNQAFMDVTPWRTGEDASFTVRAGRQLVSLGSTRLIATGAGLNVEQPFDGFRLTLHAAGWTADGLALRPTLIESGAFDNQPNATEELWGLYLTHPMPRLPRSHFDLYYLGFDHKNARYTQGSGREQRETLGVRLWSHTPSWDYDFEYTGQFGRFNRGDIRAWGAGYHFGYVYSSKRFAPHPEIDGGVLSGDHNPHDDTLGTFNPLFPNGNYLSESILLGPYNLIITRPTFKLSLTRKATSNTNEEFLWRQSKQDGVYNIAGILIHPPNGSSASYIGSQFQEVVDYNFSRHLSGALAYEHFFSGAFLKQSPPGRSLNFISPQLTWNF